MIDKYRLEDMRRESGEKGELARWVFQLQTDLDRERRRSASERATLSRLAVIMHGSETDLNLLTVTAQSLMDRCRADGAPAPVIPDEKPMPEASKMYAIDAVAAIAEVRGWNACRAAMLQNKATSQCENCVEGKRGGCGTCTFQDNTSVTTDDWIPVSERMPEGMKTVITSNGFDIGQGWWDGECWKSFDCHDVVPGKVTHWMPLPAAPQQEVL